MTMSFDFKLASLFQVTSLVILVHVSLLSNIEANTDHHISFTVDLIHRDSPLSPFYNSSETDVDRLNKAYLRSISRINHLQRSSPAASKNAVTYPLETIKFGEYLMKYSLGTPKTAQVGTIDTASDLTWTRCEPCLGCKQRPTKFDPKASSTYKIITLKDRYCNELGPCTPEKVEGTQCKYDCEYLDQDESSGYVAREEFLIGEGSTVPLELKDVVFGCAHITSGNFPEQATGMIGLGGGPLSLISQMKINGKFSYCLVNTLKNRERGPGKINFGSLGFDLISVPSTPLVEKEPKTRYHITLEAITVNGEVLYYKKKTSSTGNMIVDVGSAYTYIHPAVFKDFERILKSSKMKIAPDPVKNIGRLCFTSDSFSMTTPPTITFKFTNNCVLTLERAQAFVDVDRLVCSTILPNNSNKRNTPGVYGASGQENLAVGFDLQEKKVFFKTVTSCTDY